MLLEFSVVNYLSFDKKQTFSMVSGKGSRHNEHLILLEKPSMRINKCKLCFGANGSGKSNLIRAIIDSKNMILSGISYFDFSTLVFRGNKESKQSNIEFEYKLIIDHEIVVYNFCINAISKQIVKEVALIGKEQKKLFYRELIHGLYTIESDLIDKSDLSRFEVYTSDFTDSESFLNNSKRFFLTTVAKKVSSESVFFKRFKNIYDFFKKILPIFPDSQFLSFYYFANNRNLKEEFENILNDFDINIDEIKFSIKPLDEILKKIEGKEKIEFEQQIEMEMQKVARIGVRINNKLYTVFKDENGEKQCEYMILMKNGCEFLYEEESDGTKRIFDLVPLLLQDYEDKFILIDEIDRSLHTKITQLFIKKILSSKGKGVQYLISTHDINLLSFSLLRQDEVLFIEKKELSSEIIPFSSFNIRYDVNAAKEYLKGEFGAIPKM